MSLPLASEKSGNDRSGIDGKETDGIAGITGIMSRADFVMLSIRLGADSSAQAAPVATIIATQIKSCFIPIPLLLNRSHFRSFVHGWGERGNVNNHWNVVAHPLQTSFWKKEAKLICSVGFFC
jgi:hypothetical protein